MSDGLNRISSRVTKARSQGASQAVLYGTGLTAGWQMPPYRATRGTLSKYI